MTKNRARNLVRSLTLTRLLAGMLLPVCALNEWWGLATVIFIAAVASDMIDGELARSWAVSSNAGARLDTHADFALTCGAMVAVTISGEWYWWVAWVVLAAAVALPWIESTQENAALLLIVLSVPVVNFTLITLIVAEFLGLAAGVDASITISLTLFIWVIVGVMKGERVLQYLRDAFARAYPR